MIEYPILSIDTSGNKTSAGIILNEEVNTEMVLNKKLSQSELLIECINNCCEILRIKINDIKTICISSGPGSFTGLRVGFSTVKGIIFGNPQIELIKVPTFNAAALQFFEINPLQNNINIVSKVNSTELYFQEFSSSELKNTEMLKIISEDSLTLNDLQNFIYLDKVNFNIPSPYFVGLWSLKYGKEVSKNEIEYSEPDYIKKFIPKVKK